jgi:hypothetical protein
MNKFFFTAALAVITVLSTPAFARGGGHGGGHSGSHSSSHYGSRSSHYGSGTVNSQNHTVSGYTRHDGTHVNSYHATNPNATRNDNYSTAGNVNPYTGKAGTKPGDY